MLLCLSYRRDPERNWDHSRVKGVVAKLVRVKDPATATALEVAAGGRLYQVTNSLCSQHAHYAHMSVCPPFCPSVKLCAHGLPPA
jgi:structural maintenance of chromosome 2